MGYRVNYFSKTKRKNKYNAKKQEFGGRKYDSKFEARYAEDLAFVCHLIERVSIDG
jgi:hypothetical protein